VTERSVVLVLAEPASTRRLLGEAIERRGHDCLLARTVAEAEAILRLREATLLVLVLPISDADGRAAITRLQALKAGLPFIVSGADDVVKTALEAFDLGAHDHLDDPTRDPSQLLATMGLLLGSRRGDRHLRYFKEREAPQNGWDSVVGRSTAMQEILRVLRHVCQRTSGGSTPTILLNGETGTGKGHIAKVVHYNSVRRNHPFVEVNCAALPSQLMEAELFGHERGSFTDAKQARPGLFETADGGTLFLDEIGAVPLDLQAKLLKAIEEKNIRRLGGRASLRVDVQIIAATHEDLQARSRDGRFREDLFHRLNVVGLVMPALREREEDGIALAESFLQVMCREYGLASRSLSDGARAFIRSYRWPGNVRELRNQIERIVLLEDEDVLEARHFRGVASSSSEVGVSGSGRNVRITLPKEGVSLEHLEREIIRAALEATSGNVTRAAKFLSISRQTMMYRIKKHNLE
jgi:DNA-binding NtrC family response regulator